MPRSIGDCDKDQQPWSTSKAEPLTEDAPLNRGLRLLHGSHIFITDDLLTEDAPLNRGLRPASGVNRSQTYLESLTEDAPLNRGLRRRAITAWLYANIYLQRMPRSIGDCDIAHRLVRVNENSALQRMPRSIGDCDILRTLRQVNAEFLLTEDAPLNRGLRQEEKVGE